MLWLALAAAVLTWALIGGYIHVMNARRQLDIPNARSMHKRPVPSGAGIIAIVVSLAAWFMAVSHVTPMMKLLAVCALLLSALGWLDDMLNLPARLRFGAQLAAVLACLWQLSPDLRALPAIPLSVERFIEALAWAWFVNLFNFMDGIDGLAGSEAASVGLGYVMIAGVSATLSPLGILFAATMLGYLAWNWAPSRVMMGDAGSIPLGFLLGWMMLDLALGGYLLAALILTLAFWLDATYTLIARLLRGKLPHEAHREHFYQRAALGCGSHARVVAGFMVANVALLLLALLSLQRPLIALFATLLLASALFGWLQHLSRARESAT